MITEISDIDVSYKVLRFNNGAKSIDIKFYLKDCMTGMRAHLQNKSVDVVVTSPPYNIGVNYDGVYIDNKPESEYLAWIERVGNEIKRVLKDDGSFFLNIGSTPKNPWNAMNVANTLRKQFALQNEIHWIKSIFIPRNTLVRRTEKLY